MPAPVFVTSVKKETFSVCGDDEDCDGQYLPSNAVCRRRERWTPVEQWRSEAQTQPFFLPSSSAQPVAVSNCRATGSASRCVALRCVDRLTTTLARVSAAAAFSATNGRTRFVSAEQHRLPSTRPLGDVRAFLVPNRLAETLDKSVHIAICVHKLDDYTAKYLSSVMLLDAG